MDLNECFCCVKVFQTLFALWNDQLLEVCTSCVKDFCLARWLYMIYDVYDKFTCGNNRFLQLRVNI